MTANGDRLGVALLAAGSADLVLRSISALGGALDRLERDGIGADAVVVDRTDTAEAGAVVASLADTPVLPARDGEPDAAALLRAVDALAPEIEHVVLAATDAAPDEEALASLLGAARAGDADLTLADAADPAPYALLARRARDVLAQVAAAEDDGTPPVLALARALAAADRPIATATGAGLQRTRQRFALAGAAFAGFRLQTRVPEAATIGYGSYFSIGSTVVTYFPHDRVEIGSYCSIGDDVSLIHPSGQAYDSASGEPVDVILRGDHRPWTATNYPIGILSPEGDDAYDEPQSGGPVVTRPLQVGNDVWIGSTAVLVGPLTVGDGAVIGAGAVVRRDVRPYEIVVGNPAQPVRRRFDDRTCERLLNVRWWDWAPELVAGNHRRFTTPIAAFLDRFDPAGSLAADAAPDAPAGAAVSAVS